MGGRVGKPLDRIPNKGEMALNGSTSTDRTPRDALLSAIVSMLAMAAILLSLLGIHSARTGPEFGVALPVASSSEVQPSSTLAIEAATAGSAVTVAVHTARASTAWAVNGMLGCALIAMSCGLLLVLACLLLRARSAAVHDRLLDDVGPPTQSTYGPPLHTFRPNLTLLSVSRV